MDAGPARQCRTRIPTVWLPEKMRAYPLTPSGFFWFHRTHAPFVLRQDIHIGREQLIDCLSFTERWR
jgi:hypothetical protein